MNIPSAVQNIKANFRGRLLAPYQPAGVKWMLERELSTKAPGGILADEMGLGKTIMTIATMIGNPQKNTLVIVPKAVLLQWQRAFKQFAGVDALIVTASDVHRNRVSQVYLDTCPVVLTTYSCFNSHTKTERKNPFLSMQFGRLVLDEAQYIKNMRSKSHIVICQIEADIKWCLTGTPVAKSAKDFKALMWFLGVCSAMMLFDMAKLAKQYVLRRTKDDISRQVERLRLPPIDIEVVSSNFRYPEEREMYLEMHDFGKQMWRAYQLVGGGQMEILEHLLRMRQCVTNPQLVLNGVHKKQMKEGPPPRWTHGCTKLDMLREQLIAQPKHEKTLIFCHWTYEMDAVEMVVCDLGMRSVRLDGSMSSTQRDDAIALFTSSPTINTFVIQIDSGGVGLNLHMATRVYINSLHWNATAELQAIGRAHRTGQTKKVWVKRLAILPATIDKSIVSLQENKLRVASIVLSDPRIQDQLSGGKITDGVLFNHMFDDE